MAFLSPWMLAGLATVFAPIIIHLMQKRHVIEVPFATLRFLKIVSAKTRRSARFENLLLLLLRCLIFLLLAAAAARPVVSSTAAKFFGGSAPRSVIVIVDHSASMTYRTGDTTRLEVAKKEALLLIDSLKAGDQVAVMAANDRVQLLIAEPTIDHDVVRKAIQEIQPTEARTDFAPAMREARKLAIKAPKGQSEVFLFTDNQEDAWLFDSKTIFDDEWKKSEAKLVVVRPDDVAAVNAGIKNVALTSLFVSAGSTVRGTARIENFSSAPLHDVLEINVNSDRAAQRSVDVEPGGSVEVPFDFQAPTLAGRTAQAIAKIQGDNLALDDKFFFEIPIFQAPRVVIVEGQQIGPEKLHSGFFLHKALLAGGGENTTIKKISTTELDDTPIENYSTVFLADPANLSDRGVVKLDRFAAAGGTVALLAGDETNIDNLSRIDFLPAKPGGLHDLPAGRLVASVVEKTHPLFVDLWSGDTQFPALPQKKVIAWKPNKDAKVLVTFGDKEPFLIEGVRGSGRVLIINASPDRAWGDFPLSPAFLPLVQQIVRMSAAQVGRQMSYFVGDSIPASAALPRDQPLTIKMPDGTTSGAPAGEKATILDRAEHAGFYEVLAGNEGALQSFAVNVDRRESVLRPIATEALEKIVPNETVTGFDNLRLWLARDRGHKPLWPLLLMLALLAFAAESVLSNLAAAKRSQGGEAHIKTGRLNKRRIGVSFRPEMKEVQEHAHDQPMLKTD